jgi:hypothetical protein
MLIIPLYHDSNKVNGLDFPARIRQSKFASFKDIEGMDPLQVRLWKFRYQGLHNTWLRRIAYGRETFVLPFDNIGTTVFIADLVAQLRTRTLDLDKLAAYKSRASGHNVTQKEAIQYMAKEVAQLMQSWLPTQPVADTDFPYSSRISRHFVNANRTSSRDNRTPQHRLIHLACWSHLARWTRG